MIKLVDQRELERRNERLNSKPKNVGEVFLKDLELKRTKIQGAIAQPP